MPEARSGFHHGHLREALVREGLAMSRERGAAAIVLREATRRAGVTARAAYRHFADRDALVRAVAQAALAEMARTIQRRQEGAADGPALLRGVGEGYIEFALDEPGWFDVAFFAMPDMVDAGLLDGGLLDPRHLDPGLLDPRHLDPGSGSGGGAGRSPYQQLQDALAGLVDAGLLDPGAAGDAAVTCWSGVHGFATLAARGPLRALPRDVIDAQAGRLVADLVEAVTNPVSARLGHRDLEPGG